MVCAVDSLELNQYSDGVCCCYPWSNSVPSTSILMACAVDILELSISILSLTILILCDVAIVGLNPYQG